MKLEARELIEGTRITIGKRVYYRQGKRVLGKTYSAEYRDSAGQQVTESLGTRSRLEARRKAMTIFQRLEDGEERIVDTRLTIDELMAGYFQMVKARGLAPKSQHKYEADLDKLKRFCHAQRLTLANRFGREQFYAFREWLVEQGYADKTVYGVLTLCKQVFKWGHHEGKLREYRLGRATLAKAKAKPQPCFTTEDVELLIAQSEGVEKAAFATLAYAGLRIGELEQLQWIDVQLDRGELGMLHIRRGGSSGTTKTKDHRFVPIHPRVRPLLDRLSPKSGLVFPGVRERELLKRLKRLCHEIGLPNPTQYKLHSFRHHFASLCANHNVAYRKALTWLGHSSSEILDLYYHLHDADSQAAMQALAGGGEAGPGDVQIDDAVTSSEMPDTPAEGTLRATGASTIEKSSQDELEKQLTELLFPETERAGFEPAVGPEPYADLANRCLQPLGHLSG